MHQASGPRQAGQGVEDQPQEIISMDHRADGAVVLRITLLAAGFVIGPRGCCVRDLCRQTQTEIRSRTVPASSACRTHRELTVTAQHTPWGGSPEAVDHGSPAVAHALHIISAAVDRYEELTGGKCEGMHVPKWQRIMGVDFQYQPPPRAVCPHAAGIETSPATSARMTPGLNTSSGNVSTDDVVSGVQHTLAEHAHAGGGHLENTPLTRPWYNPVANDARTTSAPPTTLSRPTSTPSAPVRNLEHDLGKTTPTPTGDFQRPPLQRPPLPPAFDTPPQLDGGLYAPLGLPIARTSAPTGHSAHAGPFQFWAPFPGMRPAMPRGNPTSEDLNRRPSDFLAPGGLVRTSDAAWHAPGVDAASTGACPEPRWVPGAVVPSPWSPRRGWVSASADAECAERPRPAHRLTPRRSPLKKRLSPMALDFMPTDDARRSGALLFEDCLNFNDGQSDPLARMTRGVNCPTDTSFFSSLPESGGPASIGSDPGPLPLLSDWGLKPVEGPPATDDAVSTQPGASSAGGSVGPTKAPQGHTALGEPGSAACRPEAESKSMRNPPNTPAKRK